MEQAGWIDVAPLILAPFIGSCLGVLVHRLPRGQPIVFARSCCVTCGATLGIRDLVPLVSFALLRGHCRHCGGRISAFYPVMELAAVAVALMASLVGSEISSWWWSCLGWGLLALAWIDWQWMVLPDVLTLPLLMAGLAFAWWEDPNSLAERLAGTLVGWAAFAGLAWVYRHWRGREGLGGGDAKLLAVGGAWLGLGLLPSVVLLAAASAGFWTIGLSVWRRQPYSNTPLAFGPWLALAIWIIGLTIST
jgi:leader peptidase (prepilin peptidase)/N-methyltransferase